MLAPGPLNALADVPGLAVGHATDRDRLTGATVVLPDAPAVAAVDVRGGGPGTRETDLLGLGRTVERVHAVVISGGSAFGLAAADGAMHWLAERGVGFEVGAARVPIVPAAILFDLLTGPGPETPPGLWRELGRAACAAAGRSGETGSVGAGTGASLGGGRMRGGLGTASVVDGAVTVGALAAVNALGEALMPGTRTFWTWWLEMAGELGGQRPPARAPADLSPPPPPGRAGHTTLAVVATDAALDRQGAHRLAVMAQDGLARAIRPAHAPLDGDVVFALSTGRGAPADAAALHRLGALAADCLSRAIMRGVRDAESAPGLPAWRDLPDPPG